MKDEGRSGLYREFPVLEMKDRKAGRRDLALSLFSAVGKYPAYG